MYGACSEVYFLCILSILLNSKPFVQCCDSPSAYSGRAYKLQQHDKNVYYQLLSYVMHLPELLHCYGVPSVSKFNL